MARLQIEISEELNGWIADEVEKGSTNKTAFVSGILEAAKVGGQSAGEPAPGPQPEPATPQPATDTQRKILVTLEMFFKRYVKNDPPRKLSDAERESLDERWDALLQLRDAELSK